MSKRILYTDEPFKQKCEGALQGLLMQQKTAQESRRAALLTWHDLMHAGAENANEYMNIANGLYQEITERKMKIDLLHSLLFGNGGVK